jgi:hypothetical protein
MSDETREALARRVEGYMGFFDGVPDTAGVWSLPSPKTRLTVGDFRALLALLREERKPVARIKVFDSGLFTWEDAIEYPDGRTDWRDGAPEDGPPGTYHVYRAEEGEDG